MKKTITAVIAVALLFLSVNALAVVGYGIAPYPKFKAYVSGTSEPLVGGLLYTCVPGTVCGPGMAFPQATYTDALGTGTNTNPVVLDSNGEANVWLLTYTKMALYTASGVPIWSVDNVPPSGWTALPIGVTEVRTSDYADLNTAVTAIGGSSVALICDSNTAVTADLTIPTSITIVTEPVCNIDVGGAFTLTFEGSLSTGTVEVFTGTGAVAGLKEARPEWWGAKSDGSADATAAFNYAMAASPNVILSAGTYLLKHSGVGGFADPLIDIITTVKIKGISKESTVLKLENIGQHVQFFHFNASGIVFEDLSLKDYTSGTTGDPHVMINMVSSPSPSLIRVGLFGRVGGASTGIHGIKVHDTSTANYGLIQDCDISKVDYGIFSDSTMTATIMGWKIIGNSFYDNYDDDVELNSPAGMWRDVSITGNMFRNSGNIGVGLARVYNVNVVGNEFHSQVYFAVHVEDASRNVNIIGNTILNVERGISILPLSGVGVPKGIVIMGNTLNRGSAPVVPPAMPSDAVAHVPANISVGIFHRYLASSTAEDVIVSNNTVLYFDRGVVPGSGLANNRMDNNTIYGCYVGVYFYHVLSMDEQMMNTHIDSCNYAVETRRGGVLKHTRITNTANIKYGSANMMVSFDGLSVTTSTAYVSGTDTFLGIIPTPDRVYTSVNVVVGFSSTSHRTRRITLTYDGMAIGETTVMTYEFGSVRAQSFSIAGGYLGITCGTNDGSTTMFMTVHFDGIVTYF